LPNCHWPTYPSDNTKFDLFDFGSYTGLFSSITTASDGSWYGNLTFTGTGDKWTATAPGSQTLDFTHSTGVLVIVPEPGALALAGIGIAAAAYAARSRSRSRKPSGVTLAVTSRASDAPASAGGFLERTP
jgi:hypothetical protein